MNWRSAAGKADSSYLQIIMMAEGPAESPRTKFRVLVIAGGDSAERQVSLQSGASVAAALEDAGHIVGQLDPVDRPLSAIDCSAWDLAFPMLHGTGGEDGTLQRALEAVDLPWVGSSAAASELTFSKCLTRRRLQASGILVPPGKDLTDTMFPPGFTLPVVVKPDCQGSSIGVSLVRQESDWQPAVEQAFSFGDRIVVENWIDGREVSIAVINGEPFPPIEIVVPGGWYDYEAKYISESNQYIVDPPDLPDGIQATAAQACEVCGACGILRVDFRVGMDGKAYVLEINTIPGMTAHSLVPKAAAARGFTLAQFCDDCVQWTMAAKRT